MHNDVMNTIPEGFKVDFQKAKTAVSDATTNISKMKAHLDDVLRDARSTKADYAKAEEDSSEAKAKVSGMKPILKQAQKESLKAIHNASTIKTSLAEMRSKVSAIEAILLEARSKVSVIEASFVEAKKHAIEAPRKASSQLQQYIAARDKMKELETKERNARSEVEALPAKECDAHNKVAAALSTLEHAHSTHNSLVKTIKHFKDEEQKAAEERKVCLSPKSPSSDSVKSERCDSVDAWLAQKILGNPVPAFIVGLPILYYSRSQNQWCDGEVTQIDKDGNVIVEYKTKTGETKSVTLPEDSNCINYIDRHREVLPTFEEKQKVSVYSNSEKAWCQGVVQKTGDGPPGARSVTVAYECDGNVNTKTLSVPDLRKSTPPIKMRSDRRRRLSERLRRAEEALSR